ncbi:hypothetical protein AGMMS49983_17260 [Clostridia bacterium]|nr:hypothetical protein AGMMS49983_17260 [Clostridia bacterium]
MYCKVCGNFLSETDTVCERCGNDVEQQRKQELAATETARSGGYAQREEKSEIDREKDEAINRILYEDEAASARDRLDERRRKRAQERATGSGLGGLFAGRTPHSDAPKPTKDTPATTTFEAPTFALPVEEAPAFEAPTPKPSAPQTPTLFDTPKPEPPAAPKPEQKPEVSTSEEKPAPNATGFSFDRIESVHAAEPAKPRSPEPPRPHEPSPAEEHPRRNFRSEFVFGDRPKPQPPTPITEPAQAAPVFASEPSQTGVPPAPEQESAPHPAPAFAPAAPGVQATHEPVPAPVPAPFQADVITKQAKPERPEPETSKGVSFGDLDGFFALKVDEAEQALFDINKKNEEFQELLDEEFERLRRGGAVTSEAKSLVNDEILTEAAPTPEILVTGDNARELVEDRIEDYLKRADLDMLKEIQARLEKELAEKGTPAPVGAYIAQAEEGIPQEDAITEQINLAFPEPEMPKEVSYEILDEMFGKVPEAVEADEPTAPVQKPACDPGITATREPAPVPGFAFDEKDFGHAFSHGAPQPSDLKTNVEALIAQEKEGLSTDETVLAHETDLEFKTVDGNAPAPLTYADFEIFDFSAAQAPVPEPIVVSEPVATEPEPVPVTAEPAPTTEPAPEPAPLPTPEPEKTSPLPEGWGRGAPTREQAAAFLSQPVVLPFDEPASKPAPAPAFVTEPVPTPEPIAKPEPVVTKPEPAPAPVPAFATEPEPTPAPIPYQKTGHEILKENPQWQPETSFLDLLAPSLTEAQPDPTPAKLSFAEAPATELSSAKTPVAEPSFAEAPAIVEPSVSEAPTTELSSAEAPVAEPSFAEAPAIVEPPVSEAPATEPPVAEAPALIPPIPEPLPVVEPLPATPSAISYDDALAAPTITGAPAEPPKPQTAERETDLREGTKKTKPVGEPSKIQRNIISVVITILIIVLVLVIACIATLKFMPDSIGAYYILDFIETIQAKFSGG